MKRIKPGMIKILAVTLASLVLFCSCGKAADAASQLAGAVASSVGQEINSALSEGAKELSDGMSELKSGLSSGMDEVRDGLSSGMDEVRDGLSSGMDEVRDGLSSCMNEVRDGLSSGVDGLKEGLADVTDEITRGGEEVSRSLDSLAEDIQESINSGLTEASVFLSSLNENTSGTEAPVTSISADDTTREPSEKTEYTFRNKQRYDEHYKKHGAEFGNITKEEYLRLANELINSESDRVLHKYSEDGDYMYFDQDTGYFLVLSEDGYIRTFFIPTAGIKYWERQ